MNNIGGVIESVLMDHGFEPQSLSNRRLGIVASLIMNH